MLELEESFSKKIQGKCPIINWVLEYKWEVEKTLSEKFLPGSNILLEQQVNSKLPHYPHFFTLEQWWEVVLIWKNTFWWKNEKYTFRWVSEWQKYSTINWHPLFINKLGFSNCMNKASWIWVLDHIVAFLRLSGIVLDIETSASHTFLVH